MLQNITPSNNQQERLFFRYSEQMDYVVNINNRAAPYIALALALYEDHPNPIQFATEHLDNLNQLVQQSTVVAKIVRVYQTLEMHADTLGVQPVITLPQLTNLFNLGQRISDAKVATAVLTSLAARHLAFKSESNYCSADHLLDSKNIIANVKAYLQQ